MMPIECPPSLREEMATCLLERMLRDADEWNDIVGEWEATLRGAGLKCPLAPGWHFPPVDWIVDKTPTAQAYDQFDCMVREDVANVLLQFPGCGLSLFQTDPVGDPFGKPVRPSPRRYYLLAIEKISIDGWRQRVQMPQCPKCHLWGFSDPDVRDRVSEMRTAEDKRAIYESDIPEGVEIFCHRGGIVVSERIHHQLSPVVDESFEVSPLKVIN